MIAPSGTLEAGVIASVEYQVFRLEATVNTLTMWE
jgi:hypothetical protein